MGARVQRMNAMKPNGTKTEAVTAVGWSDLLGGMLIMESKSS